MSHKDESVGLPLFLTCCEMLVFGTTFLRPFTARAHIYSEVDREEVGLQHQTADRFLSAALMHACCSHLGHSIGRVSYSGRWRGYSRRKRWRRKHVG